MTATLLMFASLTLSWHANRTCLFPDKEKVA